MGLVLKDVQYLTIYADLETSPKRNSINKGGQRNHDFPCVNVAMFPAMSEKRRHDTGDRKARETSKHDLIGWWWEHKENKKGKRVQAIMKPEHSHFQVLI